jgi:hypothetical protein
MNKKPSYGELLNLAGATAQRFGFASGLRKARADLLRARRRYGLNDLKGLRDRKEKVFQSATSLEEARKQIAEINQTVQGILTQMRENTVEEQAKVNAFLNTVKYYDSQVVRILTEIGMYREYNEIAAEIMEQVKEWKKTVANAKKEKEKCPSSSSVDAVGTESTPVPAVG